MARREARLSVALPDDGTPREIRLLRPGMNESTNGDFLFDDQAAADVMATWKAHSGENDHPGMVDLEHLSLDPSAVNFDPDARAWFDLEVRDGALWLVDLKWCPDGEARVKEKRQRYLSPTINYDSSTRRVRSLVNVALTALPALHGAPELIAARATSPEGEAIMADQDNGKAMADILKALGVDPKMPDKVAGALGLEAGASIDDIRAALDSFAAKMAKVEELLADGAEEPAAEEEAPAVEEPAPMAEEVVAEEEEEKVVAARVSVEEELVTLRAFKASIEDKERNALVAKMVTLGAEDPATAWADDSAKRPAEPWASMGLTALRSRVAKLTKRSVVLPPASGTSGGLTEAQLKICKEYNIEPARFAQLRAQAGR